MSIILTTTTDFTAFKTSIKTQIDDAAGAARAQLVTIVPGQEYIYFAKYNEAVAYEINPSGNYPFLDAEVLATGDSKDECAADIMFQKQLNDLLLAEVEKFRIESKRGVDNEQNRTAAIEYWLTYAQAAFDFIVNFNLDD